MKSTTDVAADTVLAMQNLAGGAGDGAAPSPAAPVPPAGDTHEAAPPAIPSPAAAPEAVPAPAPEAAPAPAPVPPPLDPLVQGALSAFNADLVPPPPAEPPAPESAPEPEMTPEEQEAIEEEARRNPQAGHVFARLRAEVKEARRRAEDAERARAEFQAQQEKLGEERARFAKELEEKDRAVADMQERLGRVNLEASPKFQQKYDLRIQESVGRLANNLVKWGKVEQDKASQLATRLVRATPDQLDAELSKVSPAIAGMVMSAWQDVQGISTERQAALHEWKKSMAALKIEETQNMTQEAIRQRQTLAEKSVEEAAGSGCFVYRDIGTPESKAASKQYRDAFAGFVQNATQSELVRKAADGFAAPTLYQVIKLQADRIKQLEAGAVSRRAVSELPVGSYDPAATPGSMQPHVVPVVKGSSPLERAENAAAQAVRTFQAVQRR